jgi:hypothetical protein
MRKILLTAAALALGTSAHAYSSLHEDWHARGVAATAASAAAVAVVPAAFANWSDPTAAESAKTADDGGLSWAEADIKSKESVGGMSAATATAAELHALAAWMATKSADDGGMVWAESDIKSKDAVGGTMMAKADTGTGMGGPLEDAQGYPACRPGPGDDRCIQLYERGVRDDLAAYKATEGVAMGGPFEPAADAKSAPSTAQAGGAKVPDDDATVVEGEADDADAHAGHDMTNGAKPAATATPAPNGIGGPIEARSGYPACSRTVTDSCIQLHERGVTGQGN